MMQGVYNQTITYWAEAAMDGFGERTFSAPVTFVGRWEERTDLKIEFDGEVTMSKAVVYLQDDVILGGYLALGDLIASLEPTDLAAAYIIKSTQQITSISGIETIRKVLL